MTHALLFASAFATVFLLGFQQQNVAGGPCGIVGAMWAHPRLAARWRRA